MPSQVLKTLSLAGLTPVRAQVRVTDATYGLGTGVDLLCTRRDGKTTRHVIVEIKAGFNVPGAYDMSTGPMLRGLNDIPNSPRMQHKIQTVVTRALFMACHPEIAAVDACVLRVTDDGVHIHPVEKALFAKAPLILSALAAARDKTPTKGRQ